MSNRSRSRQPSTDRQPATERTERTDGEETNQGEAAEDAPIRRRTQPAHAYVESVHPSRLNAMEITALRGQVSSLRAQLAEAEERMARMLEDRAEDADLIGKLLGRIAELESRQGTTTRVEDLQTQLTELSQRLETVQHARLLEQDEGKRLRGKIEDYERKLTETQTALEQLRAAYTTVQNEVTSLREALQSTRQELDRRTIELTESRALLERAQAQVSAVHTALAATDRTMEAVSIKLKEFERREMEIARLRASSLVAVRRLMEDMSTLRQSLSNATTGRAECETNVASHQAQSSDIPDTPVEEAEPIEDAPDDQPVITLTDE